MWGNKLVAFGAQLLIKFVQIKINKDSQKKSV